jgi:hypothetical protein
MRKASVAVVMAMATAGLTGGLATSASANPPANYGQCVRAGAISPSDSAGTVGPTNTNSFDGAGAALANERSGGNSRWDSGQGCGVKG